MIAHVEPLVDACLATLRAGLNDVIDVINGEHTDSRSRTSTSMRTLLRRAHRGRPPPAGSRRRQRRAHRCAGRARACSGSGRAPSIAAAEADLATATEALGVAERDHERATKDARHHADQLAESKRQLEAARMTSGRLSRDALALEQRLASTTDAGECQECHQPLVSDEARALPDRLRVQLGAVRAEIADAEDSVETWNARISYLESNPPKPVDDTILRKMRERAQTAHTSLGEAKTLAGLAGTLDEAAARGDRTQARLADAVQAHEDAAGRLAARGRVDRGRGRAGRARACRRHGDARPPGAHRGRGRSKRT